MPRRPKAVPSMTVAQFEATFPDEDACKTYLQARRWPNGVHCPRCGNTKVFPVSSMPFKWQCYECAKGSGYRFSVIAGTIFENTNKPLRDWFRVVHLMLSSRKGMSALQIQRLMGFGSYGTAHSMCHKIRAALIESEAKLGGIVEVDESYIGGKDKNKHKHLRGFATKVPVIGAIARKGNVIARVLDSVSNQDAEAFVREAVSNKQYVVGAVHTNTIEGFWSIFKRGIVGSFHKVSRKYMPLYIA